MEVLADDHAVAAADGQLRLELGVADGHDVLVDVEIVGDDLLLASGLGPWDFDRRERVGQGVGQLAGAIGRAIPAEHPIQYVVIGEQVRDRPNGGIARDVVEQDREAAVERLLDAGQLEITADRDVGLQQQALRSQPVNRRR